MTDNLRPLSKIAEGQTVKLIEVNAGRGLKMRLASMGILPQVTLTVVNNRHPGPFMVSVKGTKIMLGRGMAEKILVK